MVDHVWDYQFPPDELGVVVHGAALLGRGPGVAVGLECIFGHPSGLHLWVRLLATGLAAATAEDLHSEHRHHPPTVGHGDRRSFALIAEADGKRGPVDQSQRETGSSHDRFEMHASYWVGELPDDHVLTVTVAWPEVGLPATTSALLLADLADIGRRTIPLHE